MTRRQDKAVAASALASLATETTLAAVPDQRRDQDGLGERRENDHPKAPRWSTVQQTTSQSPPKSHSNSHPLVYPDGGSPHSSIESAQLPAISEDSRMPDDSSTRGEYRYNITSAARTQHHHYPHHHHPPHHHAPQHQVGHSNGPYPSSARRRSYSQGSGSSPTDSPDHSQLSCSPSEGTDYTSSNHQNHSVDGSSSTAMRSPVRRRTRVLMTRVQSEALNKLWSQTMFPSTSEREVLAQQIGLTARQVQVWFQNQRQKRRRERESEDAVPLHDMPYRFPESQSLPTGWGQPAFVVHQSPTQPGGGSLPVLSYQIPHSAMVPPQSHVLSHPGLPFQSGKHASPRHSMDAADDGVLQHPHGRHNHRIGDSAPRSWRSHGASGDHVLQGNGADQDIAMADSDPPPMFAMSFTRESHPINHRPFRSRSTSHPYAWSQEASVTPPSSTSSGSHAYVFETKLSTSPSLGLRRRTYEDYRPTRAERADRRMSSTGQRSAPSRTSHLPPSLSAMVIGSPYESGADDALSLQPLQVSERSVVERPTATLWRSAKLPSPTSINPRARSSSPDDMGRNEASLTPKHKSVAELLN